ncbi:MAG: matrixin family metalloprotease [Thermoguttaceae bacterium]
MIHSSPQALHAAVAGNGGPGVQLSAAMLEPVVVQAQQYWRARGVDPRALGNLSQVKLRVADLSGSLLGMASTSDLVWIDRDAAGYGWAIDASASSGGMDLLSVVTHELGHKLGFHDGEDYAVMAPTLAPGARNLSPAISGVYQSLAFATLNGLTATAGLVPSQFKIAISGMSGLTVPRAAAPPADDDILISGVTLYDSDPRALYAIMDEWMRLDLPYLDRIATLKTGTRRDANVKLNSDTVFLD